MVKSSKKELTSSKEVGKRKHKKVKKPLIASGIIWVPLLMGIIYFLCNIYIQLNGGFMHLSLDGHLVVWSSALGFSTLIGIKNAIDSLYYRKRAFASIKEYLFAEKYSRERAVAMFPFIKDELLYKEPVGIVLGRVGRGNFKRYICIDVNDKRVANHMTFIGTSGVGKSSLILSSLIPAFSQEKEPSMAFLVVDSKPELAELSVSNERYARVINPLQRDAYGWNLYWSIDENSTDDEVYGAIKSIVEVLIPETSEQNAFFINNARNVLTALLMFDFLHYHRSFAQAIRKIMSEELTNYIKTVKDMTNKNHRIYMLLAEYGREGDKSNALQDIRKTISENLEVFGNDNVEWFLDTDVNIRTCCPRDLDSGISLFLSIPNSELKKHRVLFRLIISQCMETLSMRKDYDPTKKPVVLVLDELTNLGAKIPSYTENLGFFRSKKVTCISIFQQYSELQALYGREHAKTILNMGHIAVLSCEDTELGKVFSDKAGEFEETKVDYKKKGFLIKYKVAEETVTKTKARRVRVMDDLSSLVPRDEVIVFINGSEYYRFDKCRYYLDPELNAKALENKQINQIKKDGYIQED